MLVFCCRHGILTYSSLGQKSAMGLTRWKWRFQQDWISFQSSKGECFPCLCQLLAAFCFLWLWEYPAYLQAVSWWLFPGSISLIFLKRSLLLLSCFSHVRVCATLWTAALQAPLSTGFSRQEYWSGLPFPSPEEIASLFHSIFSLYFFVLITEEGFLISPCYSLELCIQMGISFLFSFIC